MKLLEKQPRQKLSKKLAETGMRCTESLEHIPSKVNSIDGIILAALIHAKFKLPDTTQFNI